MPTARALQFVASGQVQLIDVEIAPPAPDQLALRMLATSLCNYSELRSFRGGEASGYGSQYPMLPGEPGHEGVGEIIAIGENVEGFAPGELVAVTGWGGDPAHCSHLLRRASAVAKIHPHERDPKPASILEMFGCAYHCLRVGWSQPAGYDNSNVAVIGAGAIGLCSLQLLRLWPLTSITVFDANPAKLELAQRLGADQIIAVPRDEAVERFARKLGRFELVAECSGHVSGQKLAHALRPPVLINVSYCPLPFPVNQAEWFEATTTIYNPGIVTDGELCAVANLYNRRLLDPDSMISRRLSPDPASYLETIAAIARGEIVKALVDWEA